MPRKNVYKNPASSPVPATPVKTVRSWRSVVGHLLLFVVVLHLLARTWKKDAMTIRAVDAIQGRSADEALSEINAVEDRQFIELGGGKGNIALRFDGLDPSQPETGFALMRLWYRAAYAVYPRRVLLAPPECVLNSTRELNAAPKLPDDATLSTYGVTTELTIKADPRTGMTEPIVRAISPSTRPADANGAR